MLSKDTNVWYQKSKTVVVQILELYEVKVSHTSSYKKGICRS